MKGTTAVLGAVCLVMVAVPATASSQVTYSCEVDVGAPLVSLEPGGAPDSVDAIGGCTLAEDISHTTVVSVDPGDSSATPTQDCSIGYDEDDDGVSEGFIDDETESIPAGSDIVAFCDAGFDLSNSITLS